MLAPRPHSYKSSPSNSFASSTNMANISQPKAPTYMARLIQMIDNSLTDLGIDTIPDPIFEQIEDISIFIHESMSTSSRNYHSVQHVFDVARDLTDPLAILAALFHDVVYFHVDGGLSALQASKLKGTTICIEGVGKMPIYKPYSTDKPTEMAGRVIDCSGRSGDELLCMVEAIFGFSSKGNVSYQAGLNEFLSAVIAVRELRTFLPLSCLAQIACCIEATIPFRGNDPSTGLSAMDRLYSNMKTANQSFSLGLSESDLVKSVQRAVTVANSDISNFGTDDPAWFLDNTWSLLPESNVALRQHFLYSVDNFFHAVYKMYGFFQFLQYDVVFSNFRGMPPTQELQQLQKNTALNLNLGKSYVGAKLLSLSIVSALAKLTGGNSCPIALMLGDLPSRHRISLQLADTLPAVTNLHDDCDDKVYQLLHLGRTAETSFDIRQSPLAAYFYAHMGKDAVLNTVQQYVTYPMTEESAKELLLVLPRKPLRHVIGNMTQVAVSRARELQKVLDYLVPDNEVN